MLFFAVAFTACQTDSYESGQGDLSLVTADFAEVHTVASGVVDYAVTDAADSLALASPFGASWASVADTMYRAIVYYDRSADAKVRARSIVEVPVLAPVASDRLDSVYTDPLDLESVWVSAGGKYLNMGVYVKVGYDAPADAVHSIGVVVDTVSISLLGKRTAHLRLYHDQGGVPEYFSSKTYLSVRCADLQADSAVLSVNTWNGPVERRISLSEQ